MVPSIAVGGCICSTSSESDILLFEEKGNPVGLNSSDVELQVLSAEAASAEAAAAEPQAPVVPAPEKSTAAEKDLKLMAEAKVTAPVAAASNATERRSSIRRRSDAPELYPSDEPPEPALQLEALPSELKAHLQPIDADNSGTVEWEEFLAYALPSGLEFNRIRQLWKQLSSDQAGAFYAEVKAMAPTAQVRTPAVTNPHMSVAAYLGAICLHAGASRRHGGCCSRSLHRREQRDCIKDYGGNADFW